ncbi:MAG: RsmB/NOP family class I SAM-dependent RNA methyltransferase [Candidatus Pacearchaeota archaeon]
MEKKELFLERMQELFMEDFEDFERTLDEIPKKSIRVNTLKISPEELIKKLNEKKWKLKQPFKTHPEIMIVESDLNPGELGRSLEHLLGYYYVQDISSMIPVMALKPEPGQLVLDLCASPGSKTSQIAQSLENKGTIIANEIKLGRVKILASNLERCGVSNAIITKAPGQNLCKKLKREGFQFDKILIDAPCSGEGTIKNIKGGKDSIKMWHLKKISSLSKVQKKLLESAFEILKPGGELVYSTCTFAPEENEEVIESAIDHIEGAEIQEIKSLLPKEFKTHEAITEWKGIKYNEEVKKALRVYPQDNNTEGFFIAKFKKVL